MWAVLSSGSPIRFLTDAAATVIFSIRSPLDLTKTGIRISRLHDSRFHPNRSRDFSISLICQQVVAPGVKTYPFLLISPKPGQKYPDRILEFVNSLSRLWRELHIR
jgi:hypothetical protein